MNFKKKKKRKVIVLKSTLEEDLREAPVLNFRLSFSNIQEFHPTVEMNV